MSEITVVAFQFHPKDGDKEPKKTDEEKRKAAQAKEHIRKRKA